MKHSLKVERARMFCIAAHSACGQIRKYSMLPYHTHPQDVVDILVEHVPHVTQDMLAAAYLHDVVEDTKASLVLIDQEFGKEVGWLVNGLTKTSWGDNPPPRRERFRFEVARIKGTCANVKTIKIADSIANMRDFIRDDPKYSRNVYLPEKRILLDSALKEGDTTLWNVADKIIKDFYKEHHNAS